MKKINGFSITKLIMTGFKCFEETTSFDFGDTTFITASNGQGKSSIADALAFAFVGTPFFGDKGLDRLQNKFTQEMSVSVDIVDDTGEMHNLTRSRKRDATTITYDGIIVRQTDLNEAFGGKDVFLSILNPLYFVDVLGDSGKKLLEKLLPTVKQEDVLAALPEPSRKLLADRQISSPEVFVKGLRSELKELDESLISYRGQKELLDYQKYERKEKLKEINAAIENISAEMAELEEIRDNGIDRAAEETRLSELKQQRAELLSEVSNGGVNQAMREVMDEIKAVEKDITKISAKQYKSQYTSKIAEAEMNLKTLYSEHGKVSKALDKAVVGYKCPTCAAVITEKNLTSVKADLQKRLSELVDKGKNTKIDLTEIISQDNNMRDAYEREKAKAIERENGRLVELNQRLQEMNISLELDKEDYGERLSSLETTISEQEKRIANGNWTEEQSAQYKELEDRKKSNEAQIKALKEMPDYDYATLIADTETEISKIKVLINEAIQYMAKRIELMLDGLKMSSTEIVLTELVKTTGELKDCFRFSYEGRDYKCLSLSEKVRAGLDVAVLIKRLTGRNYPIFVDNGESICHFGKVQLGGQVIVARVVNNQKLQVAYKNREAREVA
ncbi:MAG: AAA family ATPase [Eubacterium sp.]|nr:AAA family ATPase [Eubacterium sp.]